MKSVVLLFVTVLCYGVISFTVVTVMCCQVTDLVLHQGLLVHMG